MIPRSNKEGEHMEGSRWCQASMEGKEREDRVVMGKDRSKIHQLSGIKK